MHTVHTGHAHDSINTHPSPSSKPFSYDRSPGPVSYIFSRRADHLLYLTSLVNNNILSRRAHARGDTGRGTRSPTRMDAVDAVAIIYAGIDASLAASAMGITPSSQYSHRSYVDCSQYRCTVLLLSKPLLSHSLRGTVWLVSNDGDMRWAIICVTRSYDHEPSSSCPLRGPASWGSLLLLLTRCNAHPDSGMDRSAGRRTSVPLGMG